MDEVYTDTRDEIEKLSGSTAEVVEARRIHRNFKDEATRARVHHKTNLITADLYTMESIFLQVKHSLTVNLHTLKISGHGCSKHR